MSDSLGSGESGCDFEDSFGYEARRDDVTKSRILLYLPYPLIGTLVLCSHVRMVDHPLSLTE